MISYVDALAVILQQVPRLPSEWLPLEIAHGRILAEPVLSRCPMPPVAQAEVEGYALHCGDAELPAGTEIPLLSARQLAREHPLEPQGQARRITCNAALPPGLDAVLPSELGQRLPPDAQGVQRLRLKTSIRGGSHVRQIGSDGDTGAEIMAAGQVLDGPHVLLAASVGAKRVRVVARPQIAILSSGQPQGGGMDWLGATPAMRDANASYLEIMSRTMGADTRLGQGLGGCTDYFEAMLQRACEMGLNLIICTRGLGGLRTEQMMASLRRLGAHILFHTVAFAPGSSLICARFADGAIFFGILAESAAMAAAYRFFITPTLGQMQGRTAEQPVRALLAPPLPSISVMLPVFRRAHLYQDTDGGLWVQIPPSDDPYSLRQMRSTNAWAVIPPHASSWRGETYLDVYGTLPDMLDIPVQSNRSRYA